MIMKQTKITEHPTLTRLNYNLNVELELLMRVANFEHVKMANLNLLDHYGASGFECECSITYLGHGEKDYSPITFYYEDWCITEFEFNSTPFPTLGMENELTTVESELGVLYNYMYMLLKKLSVEYASVTKL